MPDWDDLFVLGGVVCLALAVGLTWGWVAILFVVGVAMIAAGIGLAARGNDREQLDRTKGG